MNRRSFFKFLGIGAATAVVVPKAIAEAVKEPEPKIEFSCSDFEWVPIGNIPQGKYIYVKLPKSTLPFRAGDIVWCKKNKKGETIAFRDKKRMTGHKEDEFYAMAIGDLTPGNYGFIQIMERRW